MTDEIHHPAQNIIIELTDEQRTRIWKARYPYDRKFADQFIPAMKQIIGPHLLQPSSLEVDQEQAADLVILKARDMAIACRVRRAGYVTRYGREFTVRSHRDSGAKTELAKIREGWADWMFYAHAEQEAHHCEHCGKNSLMSVIGQWFLIDLDSFRDHVQRNPHLLTNQKANRFDGTGFTYFDVDDFAGDPQLLIAESA